jgi:hypothetical protein
LLGFRPHHTVSGAWIMPLVFQRFLNLFDVFAGLTAAHTAGARLAAGFAAATAWSIHLTATTRCA